MGRRSRQRAAESKLAAPTTDYHDTDGNVLSLRGSLTPASRRQYAEVLHGGHEREDAWQRAIELLFERLDGCLDDRRNPDHPAEGAAGALSGSHSGRAAVCARFAAHARDRELPRAGGAMRPDPDAFAALLCEWCVTVGSATR